MRSKAVGQIGSGFKLVLTYKLRPGEKRTDTAHSNNLVYGKRWATREELTAADALAFRRWVEGDMTPACSSGSKPRDLGFRPASRASERVEEREAARGMSPIRMATLGDGAVDNSAAAATSAAAVAATAAEANAAARQERQAQGRLHSWGDAALVEAAETAAAAASTAAEAATAAHPAASVPDVHPEIWRCVEWLKTKLVRRARAQADKVRAAAQAMIARVKRQLSGVAARSAKRQKLNWGAHRKAAHRHHQQDAERREIRAAQKVELGTAWLRPQIDRLTELLATRTVAGLLPDGDYSERQLDRVTQQALILRRYYELHESALQSGESFEAYDLAAEAGSSLVPAVSYDLCTVRRWHAQYVESGGTLLADGRGYYERELLINEEDINRKFIKWSLKQARKDELSVEAARDYLNNELLPTLPAATLQDYKISLPISMETARRWMQAQLPVAPTSCPLLPSLFSPPNLPISLRCAPSSDPSFSSPTTMTSTRTLLSWRTATRTSRSWTS